MPLLSWSNKFSIDVEMVDDQHRKLFNLINTMYDLLRANSAGKALSDALDALIDYTKYHFKAEEELMLQIEYVRYSRHKLAHENLTRQAVDFKGEMTDGKGNADEFLNFLYNWLTKHIMEEDKKIGKFIAQGALKPANKDI